MVLQKAPAFAKAHLGSGSFVDGAGKVAEARAHLEKAAESGDAGVREAATIRALGAVR